MPAIFAIVKRIFAINKICFIITAVFVLCATSSGETGTALSNGNYTWLAAVMAPFFTVYYGYAKLICLGASKRAYYVGSLVSYGLLSLFVSGVNGAIRLFIDPLNGTQRVVNMMDLCGWMKNGIVAAFFQQTMFLLLVMIFLHVLLSMQPHWYGWLVDGILAAVICVFTPIAPLRQILAGFFKLIMFNPNPSLHIGVCLLISAALSFAGLAVLKRKSM